MPSLTWEPSFVCQKQADSLGGCEQKATGPGTCFKKLHVASLHRAGDSQLGLLVICMENVILCHLPAQRLQQLGSWGHRSFGVQKRFFFIFLLKMRKNAVKWSL